jgi:lipopolysaccharide transport system ATP-binding protein
VDAERADASVISRPLVEVRGVGKRFPLLGRRRERAWGLLGATGRLAHKVALEDVSLSVGAGETVGLIGENGSGKTTLLRIIAGTTSPTTGTVRVEPPVSAILELGLGFHPSFTGRENAILYGALVGVPEEIMQERLATVLEFAELGEAIDQPLRTYSSGMSARLAFSVATHVEPRVLVVDEVLAVGDTSFQKKCIDRMVRFKDAGGTVLFCTHSMYMVTSFCQTAVWLREGRVEAHGPAHEVVRAYESFVYTRDKRRMEQHALDGASQPGGASITGLRVIPDGPIDGASPLRFEFEIDNASAARRFQVAVAIDTADGRTALLACSQWDGREPFGGRERLWAALTIPNLPVQPGEYTASAVVFDETGLQLLDRLVAPQPLVVTGGDRWTPALLRLPHAWESGER